MILFTILAILSATLVSGLKEAEKTKPECRRAKRVRAVLKFANQDCLLNQAGETNGETFIGFGFKTPDECAKACACRERGTKFIAYGKTTGCTGDFGCFNPTACFCEKTKKCDKRIDATNIYDVYKIRRNRRRRERKDKDDDAQIGDEALLGTCQNSVSVNKKYTGADCNDIKVNGEVYLGSKDTPEQCANACACQYPGTKFITYGKKGECGALGCLNPKACFCEKTQSCSSQDSVGWYDVYEMQPKSTQIIPAALVGGIALFGIGAGLYVKRRIANKQIENYELLSNEHV